VKYYYRPFDHPDFPNNKPRFTRGRFAGWFRDGFGIRRAIFVRRSDTLLIPEYCLTAETKAALPKDQEYEHAG
jgi:hypothetical protein